LVESTAPEHTTEQATVARYLRQASDRMDQAMEALGRASRMRFVDVLKAANVDPAVAGDEEAHVKTALNALMEAVERISDAYRATSQLDGSDTSKKLTDCARKLNVNFKILLTDLHRSPNHRRIVAQLREARRMIPNKTVTQLIKG
jgi:hypothetical protein